MRWREIFTALLIAAVAVTGIGATWRDGLRVDVLSGEPNMYVVYPAKATPVGADRLLIEDSAASFEKKYIDLTGICGLMPWTAGTGEVHTTTANDNVIPNAGTGTLGLTGDRWAKVWTDDIDATTGTIGTLTMGGDISMATNKVTGLGASTVNGDAVRHEQLVTTDAAVALNTTHRGSAGTDHSDVGLNNTHRASDGKDHSDVVLNNTHRASDGTDHSNVVLNDTHRSSDGTDHANVVLNDTHRASNGTDHSNVVLNDTHRGSDGKDHSDVVLNNTHRSSDGKNHSDVVLNNTHRSSDGSDHTFIDQSVIIGSSPTFAVTNMTGLAMTLGTGEVYTTDANDNVNPNGGTGTVGTAADKWDNVHAEQLTTNLISNSSGNEIVLSAVTGDPSLVWKAGATGRYSVEAQAGIVVFTSPLNGQNVGFNTKETDGNATNGAFSINNLSPLSTSTDKLFTLYNNSVIKAYTGFDGDRWTATGEYRSGTASGGTGFLFNTDNTFSAGDLFVVQNNGTEAFSIEDDNNIHIWGSVDSEVADGGIAYDFNPINTFTSGTIFRFLNNSVVTLNQEHTGRLRIAMTDASGVAKIRAGESGNRHAMQLEATLNDGEAGNGAFILAHTGTALATSGDDLLKVKNSTTTMLNLDYSGILTLQSYIDALGMKQPLITTQLETYAIDLNDYTVLVDASLTADGPTITPPDGTSDGDSIFTIKKIDSTTMYVTIDPPGGDTMDNEPSIDLISFGQYITIQSDNTDWWIIAQNLGDSATQTLDTNRTTDIETFTDITGLSATVVLQKAGKIKVVMTITSQSSGGATARVGAFAVEVNGSDWGEAPRSLSGVAGTDIGSSTVHALVPGLSAGTYTVDARFRRKSGSNSIQVNAGDCHLIVEAIPN